MLPLNKYLLLNAIAPNYHLGLGYYGGEQFGDINSVTAIYSNIDRLLIHEEEVEGEEYRFIINLNRAERLAKKNTFDHKKIIIRLRPRGESGWTEKPCDVKKTCFDNKDVLQGKSKGVPWYNLPNSKNRKTAGGNFLLGPLCDRAFIEVTDPYDEVVLNSEEKGEKINMDDIFFASRALANGPDHKPYSYHIYYDNGKTLKLIVDMSY